MTTQDIIDRLKAFGYTATTTDDLIIDFTIKKVIQHIKNFCNITTIPEELFFVAVDMVVGEFLQVKKASGQLEGFEVDLNVVLLSKWQQGDSSEAYAADKTLSPEERLDKLIGILLDTDHRLVTFRRLRW